MQLSDVIKNEVAEITEYNELVKKASNINITTDTSDLVKKNLLPHKLMKSKKKILIMIMINILLLKNLIK